MKLKKEDKIFLPLLSALPEKGMGLCIMGSLFLISQCMLLFAGYREWNDKKALQEQQELLNAQKELNAEATDIPAVWDKAGIAAVLDGMGEAEDVDDLSSEPIILPEYEALFRQNQDLIGWLSIEGTVIDYPVMQTPEDENTYLYLDFNKEENKNGSLIMDTDSVVGVGTAESSYVGGMPPSSNLIIHGHTMKSGQMFGDLDLFQDEDYGKNHAVIRFDSIYERREYELIAAFYSQVYYANQEVFKYYKFFQADTQEEFDDWYQNIKKLALYDTGITAEWGDEFITLSCCAYHVEDGRFVVVGKRIK